jgi:hypothetical protein
MFLAMKKMERLIENRKELRRILAHHYMEGHHLGEEARQWLVRFGGWFPDPQHHYDGFVPRDPGVDGPCSEVDEGLREACLILIINGAAS